MRYKLRDRAEQAVSLLCEPGLLSALATWPEFSVTSFLMVSRLARWGLRPRPIIDVGANIGQFAVAAAKCFPEAVVHSYEPVPALYAQLAKTAAKIPAIQPHALALGDTEGELEFQVNRHPHSSSVLPLAEAHRKAFPLACEAGRISVEAGTLDREYVRRELRAPVLLKLDVQGYEANVIRGAANILPRIDYILTELSFTPLYRGEKTCGEMLHLLHGLGFELKQPAGFLHNPQSGEYLQMDALFSRISTPEKA